MLFSAYWSYWTRPDTQQPEWKELIESLRFIRDKIDVESDPHDASEPAFARATFVRHLCNVTKHTDQWHCSNWNSAFYLLPELISGHYLATGSFKSLLGALEKSKARNDLWHWIDEVCDLSILHRLLDLLNVGLLWLRNNPRRTSTVEVVVDFLRLAIRDGADLHGLASITGFFPVTFWMCFRARSWPAMCDVDVDAGLRLWAETLGACGINLRRYGAKETKLWRKMRRA